jgi:hypothetical protein
VAGVSRRLLSISFLPGLHNNRHTTDFQWTSRRGLVFEI